MGGEAGGDAPKVVMTWPHLLAPLLSNGAGTAAPAASGAGDGAMDAVAEAERRALTLRLTALLSVRSSGRRYLSLAFGRQVGLWESVYV